MSHKDAPTLTPEQIRFETWLRDRWARESTTVAFGRDRFGYYFATSTRVAWEQWQAASVVDALGLPHGWVEVMEACAATAGIVVDGYQLSIRAKVLLRNIAPQGKG